MLQTVPMNDFTKECLRIMSEEFNRRWQEEYKKLQDNKEKPQESGNCE
jgi:hypothetical protein